MPYDENSPKRKTQKRDWWRKMNKKCVVEGVPQLPDRLKESNLGEVQYAEARKLIYNVIGPQLRAKREKLSGHASKVANIREYVTDSKYKMGLLSQISG